jgi:hypothetical protein
MEPSGGSGVKKVGAPFSHTPVVLTPAVGGLDAEKIYDLGVETAALGKIPNAPTLNAMDWPGGLRRRKHQPGTLPKISRTKLSKAQMPKSSSAVTLGAGGATTILDDSAERPSSAGEARPPATPPVVLDPPAPVMTAWEEQKTQKDAGKSKRPYGQLVPHNNKVPRSTAEGSSVLTAHLTDMDSRYTVAGSRPGRTCEATRWKPQAIAHRPADPVAEEDVQTAAEYPLELFDEPEMFETYTEDEWLEACELQSKESPGIANAWILHFMKGKYVRVPAWILGYDYEKKRYACEVIASGEKKLVKRLAVQFTLENPDVYMLRIKTCETKRKNAHLTRMLCDQMEEISSDTIAPMSSEQKAKLIRLVLQNARLETPEDYVSALRELMLSAEASYVLAMKFAIIKERMIERNGFPDAKFVDENSPFAQMLAVYLPKPAPEKGQVVSCDWAITEYVAGMAPVCLPGWSVTKHISVLTDHMAFESKVINVSNSIYARFASTIGKFCILDVERGRSMVMLMGSDLAMSGDMIAQQLRATKKTNVRDDALPLDIWYKKMCEHRDQVVSLVSSEWRQYMVSELSDTLADTFNFFTDSLEFFAKNYISRLLTKIDLVLKLLLRQFVRDSLTEWIRFLQDFPVLPRRRLSAPPWPLLAIKMTTRNGKVSIDPSPEELMNTIDQLVASIPGCVSSVLGCAYEMVPCLNFEPTKLYEMPKDDPVLQSARAVTRAILEECFKRPLELKAAYSHYNYLLTSKVPEDFDPVDHQSARTSIDKLMVAAKRWR